MPFRCEITRKEFQIFRRYLRELNCCRKGILIIDKGVQGRDPDDHSLGSQYIAAVSDFNRNTNTLMYFKLLWQVDKYTPFTEIFYPPLECLGFTQYGDWPLNGSP